MDVDMTAAESLGGLGFNSLNKTFIPSPNHLQPRHQKHDSLSSLSANSSTNSSPTTTISTVESTSTDEKSPASSPDSPSGILPLSTFPKPSLNTMSSSNPTYRSLSPIKKARNTKNLSLNMGSSPSRPGTASSIQGNASLNANNRSSSAPSSPGFVLPSTMPRRRPSNLGLTIKLPGSMPEKSISKSQRPSLRHHVSSPSLFTPGAGKTLSGRPSRLFTPPNHFSPIETTSSSSFSIHQTPASPIEAPGPIIEMDEEDIAMMENDGEGPKSPAYPNGPVCIYEPNIFLFSEPNAELAQQFDVIVNVAREVINPFNKVGGSVSPVKVFSPAIPTGSTVDSFVTAFEEPQGSSSQIPTPRVGITSTGKQPEYIHMLWDHNTQIVADLPELVDMIKKKSAEGKKILVHCQCGVSRSASLIVAYGLFMNQRLTVQEAYDFVKERSRWIGPNMSLIYQLSDWKAKLTAQQATGRGAKGSVRGGPNAARTKLGHPSRAANSSDPTPFVPEYEEPMTAPLPYIPGQVAPDRPPSPHPMDFLKPMSIQTRNNDGGIITGIEPGPMSAPPGMLNISGTVIPEKQAIEVNPDMGGSFGYPGTPPTPGFRYEQEDIVSDLVGFPARRGSDQGDLPPPTPSFAPKGGMIFEKRALRNRTKKALQNTRDSMPPPSPVVSSQPTSFPAFNKTPSPPHPAFKAILPKPSIRSKRPELSKAISEPVDTARRVDMPARPNPEFHHRFPSIMSSIDEPPPTPSFSGPPGGFNFPMRMPTISARSKSENTTFTRKTNGATPAFAAAVPGPVMNDIVSPVDDPMGGTEQVDFFGDPRSPTAGPALPTVRSIFDVL